MKINYIISDLTKTATTKALQEIVQKSSSDILTNYIVIVPETKSIIIEKELLALSQSGAYVNVFVYSFVRLLNRLNFAKKSSIISKQTAIMLIRKIIFNNYDKLKCYQKTAKNINFAEKIYDTLQQFKSSEVSIEDLKLASLNGDAALKSKLEDIVFIYEEYQKMLGESLFDDCDKLNLLKQLSKSSDFIKNAHIFVVGFDNITTEMISVLQEFAKNAKEITFSSVYFSDKRGDKYIQNNDLFFKFKRVAENLNYAYNPLLIKSNKKGDFYSVANKLFLPTFSESKYNQNVKIFEALTKEQEINFVATKIIELVKAGARFKDIGVMLLDVSNDSEIIKKVFDEYNINYFINREINISNHSLIIFIKLCFELYLSHLSSDRVLKFLKSEYVNIDDSCKFENFVIEKGLNYNDFLKKLDDSWRQDFKDFDKFNDILIKFQDFYINFAEKLKKSTLASDYVALIECLIDEFDIENTLKRISAFQIDNDMAEEAHISEVILKKVKEFLDMLKNFMGAMKMSPDEFLQIFLSGFGAVKVNLAPVSIDCVVVQNNTDGFYDIKHMFIVGADEDKFPVMIQDSGIILDTEIEMANILSGKKIEPTTKDINAREKFLAYEALLEPSQQLFVSYSKQKSDGGQAKPSTIIKRLIKLFGENVIIKEKFKKINVSKANFQKLFAKHINEFNEGFYDLDELNKEYAVLKNDLSSYFDKFLKNATNKNQNNYIENANQLFFSNNKTSTSQFEKYFSCPYQFFASYGLRLKENKNAKLSKLDIGVIIHKIAEVFLKNINDFKDLDEDCARENISKLVDNIFIKMNLNKSKNVAALKFIYEESKRLCNFLLYEQKNSGFKAKYNEFAFFGDNATSLTLSNGTVLNLEGKIDRVDEFGDYVRIIDYKTGEVDADLFSIYYGKKIQLISYLSAISQIKDKKPAGLFYLPIHSDYVKKTEDLDNKYKMNGFLLSDIEVIKNMDYNISFDNPKSHFIPLAIKSNAKLRNENAFEISNPGQKFLTAEQFDELKIYTEKLCKQAAEEILSGYIEPAPRIKGFDADSSPCKWCEFEGFCGLKNSKLNSGRRCEQPVDINSFSETKEEV